MRAWFLIFLLVGCVQQPVQQTTLPSSGPCHWVVKGEDYFPDPSCTPGDVFNASTDEICKKGYSASVRNVSAKTKRIVQEAYGLDKNPGEIDHLISLELGGSNDVKNLWPEPSPNYKDKDKIENELHRKVCSGEMDLGEVQKQIATDWSVYRH